MQVDTPAWIAALWVTLKLAGFTTLILLIVGMPLAWWLARSRSFWRAPVGAVVALPMVLPPTVLGFYLLIGLAPAGPRSRYARHPIIEDDVIIYAGATILGRVTIGRGSTIGGNVWLLDDVPPHSVLVFDVELLEIL